MRVDVCVSISTTITMPVNEPTVLVPAHSKKEGVCRDPPQINNGQTHDMKRSGRQETRQMNGY
jgi:hypothetical protein